VSEEFFTVRGEVGLFTERVSKTAKTVQSHPSYKKVEVYST